MWEISNFTSSATPHLELTPEEKVYMSLNGSIIILGIITNSLNLLVLFRLRIGSPCPTTKIILIFLSMADFFIMIVELFVHFIPFYTQWFQVFYTDIGCGIGSLVQASLLTTSSWYILLLTLERFTAVYFPMKAKVYCTQKRILTACIMIPILASLCFCFLPLDIVIDRTPAYHVCITKESLKQQGTFKHKLFIWIVLYFFLPAIFVVTLNAATARKLAKASHLQQRMTSVVSRNDQQTKNLLARRNPIISRAMSSQSQSAITSSEQKIRKATILVITASVAFVVLMIPRGISTSISFDARLEYQTDAEYSLDNVAYLLQYLNHATNFFLYVLVNDNFRNEIKSWFCKRKSSGFQRTKKQLQNGVDCEALTQTSGKKKKQKKVTLAV
ncbi:hypothetical protein EB796_013431 [Bugula neritina]|uniref:G-protein coupled receptors family 1 profile domain-containing protein n=1 Tax=Bugula neritina TaxID=10212 RepID=A0A7J7JQP5_BUGNE|nr:hypothetical protein EB796_013431 [Bugula neritina]